MVAVALRPATGLSPLSTWAFAGIAVGMSSSITPVVAGALTCAIAVVIAVSVFASRR
jgi:hypothetical protein